jgi:uncharacterized protein DUF6639
MLKSPLAGAALIACAMVSPVQAQQPVSAALYSSTTQSGSQERCTEGPVDVMAASAKERRLACEAAAHALRLLGRCNVSPQRPLLIELSNDVRRPFGGPIFGMFDPRQEKVLITQYENAASLMNGTPFGQLPEVEFYKSIIVHELIHSVMHQNYKKRPVSHAAYEYAAYALQIESLPSDVRDKFLQTINVGADTNAFMFTDSILSFDPFFFAARAYQHFRGSADGCAQLHALLEGEVPFIWTRPLSR